ncbi:methylmalonyl Co-A mutase-associated GTPase MeaB [Kineosporia rhizophila]|uniref:methylmalonyl Co-A mutase-associated GTPase MeaB n=1 Tax=Kineosporia rhizophila TaxID=84633 RepID=UPI001E2E41F8|nr:methylmalonyl Co-A mutase-associated GTPase MeaB [Kineosporia rhizophila]MCE0539669.1 methylmalonyl Co-A mutase-associated GTPase MeaB [Kineosporia rhizophila]
MSTRATRPPFDLQEAAGQIRAGSRAWIARAITLVESTRPDHRRLAQELLTNLAQDTPPTIRVGVTGVPGAGKSTFINALGGRLIDAGHAVAVLAVDPSSTRTGGSILGDKTRMTRLASDPKAFVRPSPSAGTLGGVARATREAMVVLEAAGYDVVIVETVGVGQSETTVAEMVDTFLLLTLARSGDQLQGIKKGVLELADVIAVNKADGKHESEAWKAARELSGALHLIGTADEAWQPPVLTCSAQEGSGLDEVWAQVLAHRSALGEGLAHKRRQQLIGWTWAMVRDSLLTELRESGPVRELTPQVEAQVLAGSLAPTAAAEQILAALRGTEPA